VVRNLCTYPQVQRFLSRPVVPLDPAAYQPGACDGKREPSGQENYDLHAASFRSWRIPRAVCAKNNSTMAMGRTRARRNARARADHRKVLTFIIPPSWAAGRCVSVLLMFAPSQRLQVGVRHGREIHQLQQADYADDLELHHYLPMAAVRLA
jgi:hypothetical protein